MCSNADILAKVVLDIKAILDIEEVLADEMDYLGKLDLPGFSGEAFTL